MKSQGWPLLEQMMGAEHQAGLAAGWTPGRTVRRTGAIDSNGSILLCSQMSFHTRCERYHTNLSGKRSRKCTDDFPADSTVSASHSDRGSPAKPPVRTKGAYYFNGVARR